MLSQFSLVRVCMPKHSHSNKEIVYDCLCPWHCFSHHRILTIFFLSFWLFFNSLGGWFFYIAMPILHIKLIRTRRSTTIGVIHAFIYDDFNLSWHFFRQDLSLFSDLLWDFISFTLYDEPFFKQKQMRVYDNNICWARQCHPLRIPHANHKRSIILISILVLRAILFFRISRHRSHTTRALCRVCTHTNTRPISLHFGWESGRFDDLTLTTIGVVGFVDFSVLAWRLSKTNREIYASRFGRVFMRGLFPA